MIPFLLLAIACGDGGREAPDADSVADATVSDGDSSTTADSAVSVPDSSAPSDASEMCVPFGTSCGATPEAVCCEGTCGPTSRRCCSEEGGRCDTSVAAVNEGCCAGFACNPDTDQCEPRTCFPSVVPGASGPDCHADGETASCCDASYACTEDAIYGWWCCAPEGEMIEAPRMDECCSGNVEILSTDLVRCLAD
jgi:hypothetical protein